MTGKVSLDHFRIADDDSDPSFRFHGGLIRQVIERVAVLGELLGQHSRDRTRIFLSNGLND